MSDAAPNVRRVIRASRLCEELGHAGDTLSALEELKLLRAASRAALDARDRYGWSPEADAALEKLRAVLEGK